ncbi:MAG: ShlB/FhaC/HecB family hemolysin secretion/activation protein [Alphaproteobacteria bacterium]|nr:ShlB/FhaC/HecB family hemolysin secretion/activation protein [Alphaproteobacteria bacterium]
MTKKTTAIAVSSSEFFTLSASEDFAVQLRVVPLWTGIVIGVLALVPLAAAQEYQRIAPKSPPAPPAGPGVVPPPLPGPGAADQNRVVLPELKGLKLVDSAGKIQTHGVAGAGIVLDGLPILEAPAIRDALAAFLGKPLTLGSLHTISRTIVLWYRAHAHPFVDVAFPEQDISTGVVQAVVTEFRVGKVKTEGNEWFSSDLLRGQLRLMPGGPINVDRLNDDIAWLNQNPFHQSTIIAEKSATPGATDLVLKTEDQFPLRAYAGYDNTGLPITGRDRWNLGFNWGNALWLDHQFSYQFTSSDDFWHNREKIPGRKDNPSYLAHSVNYLAPLPWRDRLQFFGYYSQAVPRLGPDLGETGTNLQASARYIVPLPALPHTVHEIQVGYDFKSSNNNLQFGGVQVSNVTSEINQFPLVYNATVTDKFGQTAVGNTFVYSPGNLTSHDKDALYQAQSNAYAKAKYAYDLLKLTRTTRLPWDASWVMRVVGQISDRNLLPSEQLSAGGVDSVRGYDEQAATGSIGVLVSEELRSPPFSLSRALRQGNFGDQSQLVAFWDYGSVHDKQIAPGTRTSTQLASIGMGLRFAVVRYFNLRLDYGWQLRQLPGTPGHGEFGHVAITISY